MSSPSPEAERPSSAVDRAVSGPSSGSGAPPRLAVVGGGVTGLATALLARRAGLEVDVYEASDDVGGLAGCFEVGDFRFDFGPHELVSDNRELLEFLEELCGDDLLQVRKRSAQYFQGRFIAYPFKIADLLQKVRKPFLVRAIADAGMARLRGVVGRQRPRNLEEWVRGHFGNTLFDFYFGPYTRKVWGLSPSELDARTASQRIAADSIVALAVKSLRLQLFGKEDFEQTHDEQRHNFLYVRGGMGELGSALARRFLDGGGRAHLGKRLVGLGLGAAGASADGRTRERVERLDFADGTSVRDFDQVVTTMPLPEFFPLARPASPLVASHVPRLGFRGMVFCFVGFDRPQVLDHHWVYFPGEDVPFQRVTDFGHFNAGMAPPGCTGLAFELSSNPGERFWELPDQRILELCTSELERLQLASAREVVAWRVVRVRRAYPVQVTGYAETAQDVLDDLATVENVVPLGRQGIFRYCNTDECIEMALDVVPRIVAGERGVRFERDSTWIGVGARSD